MAKMREKAVVALVGEEDYLKNEELQSVLDYLSSQSGTETSEFNAKDATITAILDELRTYPFFNPRRAVVVRHADKLLPEGEELLLRYLESPAPFSTLILLFDSLDGRSRLAKALKKHGREVRFGHMREYQLPQWLSERAFRRYGKKLAPLDAGFMVEMVGVNPGLLDAELSKIASITAESKAISREDVESVVTRGRARTVFKLTESMERKQKVEALELLNDILSQGVYDDRTGSVSVESTGIAPYLLHMLNWSIGRLWKANHLLSGGKSEKEISAELKLHPAFRDKFLDNLRRLWPESECRRCHRELLATDRLIKSSGADRAAAHLESLILKICTRAMVQDTGGR
jgi:DNA polymerase-3 subunit delta